MTTYFYLTNLQDDRDYRTNFLYSLIFLDIHTKQQVFKSIFTKKNIYFKTNILLWSLQVAVLLILSIFRDLKGLDNGCIGVNDDKQNYPVCGLRLLVEKNGQY